MKITVDENLTPDNAKEKGFVWWRDIIYDPAAPKKANKTIADLLAKGYKLGQPANKKIKQNCGVGLYKPKELNEEKN